MAVNAAAAGAHVLLVQHAVLHAASRSKQQVCTSFAE